MQVFRSVLSSLICTQLVLSSLVFSHPAMAEMEAPINADAALPTDAEKADAKRLEELENAVNHVDFNRLPPGHVDSFQVVGQTLTYTNKKTGQTRVYSASEINVALPDIKIVDFEREVKLGTTENGRLLFSFENKDWIVTHEIPSIRPYAMARSKDMIVIANNTGHLSAMDAGYTRENAFKSVLFAVSVGHSNLTPNELKNVKAAFISPGVNAMKRSDNPRHVFPVGPTDPMREKLPFGDFALYLEDHGQRVQVGQFDHFEIQKFLAKGMGDLALVVFRTSPPDDSKRILKEIDKDLGLDAVTDVMEVDQNEIAPQEREALMSMSVQQLLARSKFHSVERERGSMTRAEWPFIAPKLLELAKSATGNTQEDKDAREAAARGELGNTWQAAVAAGQKEASKEYNDPRPLFRRLLTPRGMKIFAIASASGAAALVANHIIEPQHAWGIYLVNLTNAADFFPALKDAAYRKVLFLSSVSLLTAIPLAYILGIMASKKSQLPPLKALAAKTVRIYAEVGLPFYHRLVRLLRQPNFMRAMAQGVSPFEKVKAESPIGQRMGLKEDMRPGLSNPLGSDLERERVNNDKAKILNEMARQKTRVRSLAWLLALQAAGHEYGIDLATLTALSANDEMKKKELEKLAKDPKFQKFWRQVAEEIEIELKKISRNQYVEDFKKIDITELNDMLKNARELARDIKARNVGFRAWGALKRGWNNFAPQARVMFANSGMKDYNLLKNAVPNDFVVSAFWKQFVIDYFLAVVQIGLIGDRAEPEHPHNLAADPDGFLWTRRAHFFDMWDQVQQYVIAQPAQLMIPYQNPEKVVETSFAPFENISMAGKRRTTSLLGGYWKWAKLALDPTKMDEYGDKGLKHFEGKLRTVQYPLLTMVLGRWLIAGQPIEKATASFAYWQLESRWQYGYWWDLVNIGNNRFEGDAATNRLNLTNSRKKISEGVRVDDAALIRQGYDELMANHKKDSNAAAYDREVNTLMKGLESLTDADLKDLRLKYGPYKNAVENLTFALYTGSANGITAARKELEAVYADQGLGENAAARAQLGALDFLTYSLRNPPFANDHHKGVTWSSTIVLGAGPTTYLATNMIVFTFNPAVAWAPVLANSLYTSVRNYGLYYYGTKAGAAASRYAVDQWKTYAQTRETRCRLAFGKKPEGKTSDTPTEVLKKASGE